MKHSNYMKKIGCSGKGKRECGGKRIKKLLEKEKLTAG